MRRPFVDRGMTVKKFFKGKWIRQYGKSLQFRIFVIFMLVGIIPIMLIKQGILRSFEEQSITQRGSLVQNQCISLAEELVRSGYLLGNTSEVAEMELSQLAGLYNGRIVIVNNGFRIIKDTYGLDENKLIISEELLKCFQGSRTMRYDETSGFIEMTIPLKNDADEVEGVLVISTPTNDIQESRSALSHRVLLLQIGMAALVFLVALYTSRLVIRPFGRVTQSLDEMTGGFLDEDISIPDYTETQLLSEAYNRMLKRLRVLEDSRQEFVSNVSHELKTPITSVKVLADSLIAQDDVPVELYKEFMTDIGEEIDRENKIINDLLSLVKLDKKAADLQIEDKNINELLEQLIKRLKPIADKKKVELVLESFKPVVAQVDETKLSLALSNLVENAIKYNKEEGWVRVSLNVDHKYFYVKVEDSGIGIPEESQEHIFERFYRVDKSHSREIGGTGLGLAITRSAVLMHRGAIKVYSKLGEGTTFTVRIPLIHAD